MLLLFVTMCMCTILILLARIPLCLFPSLDVFIVEAQQSICFGKKIAIFVFVFAVGGVAQIDLGEIDLHAQL